MGRVAELEQRVSRAPAPVRDSAEALIAQRERLVSQAEDDQVWAEQLGPAYSTAEVAALLDVSKQAVAQRTGLLRLEQRSGAPAYPVFQFDGDRVLPGIQTVVQTLAPQVATPWTTASWLTSPQRSLDGTRPVDALRRGEVNRVVEAAHRFAAVLSR